VYPLPDVVERILTKETDMIAFLVGNAWGIVLGLGIGWLLLPQPRFVTWAAEKIGLKDRAP
jgi:hypothetical protein